MASNVDSEVLVIGAGFGGVYILYNLRKAGFRVKIVEKEAGLGGIWNSTRYPGARVDSDMDVYQFSDKSAWDDWEWTQRFPARDEIVEYFNHLDKKWDLKRDILFNCEVISADFDGDTNKWHVVCQNGSALSCKWLIAACGYAAKPYTPSFKGWDSFKGQAYHSSQWPQTGIDFSDKKVAVIGTGASGVQAIQAISPSVEHLTVYQRSPNLALPMQQKNLDKEEQKAIKETEKFRSSFSRLRTTFGGFAIDLSPNKCIDATENERRAFFEQLYAKGGFSFWIANYSDVLFDEKANELAYKFWVEKARARISDPKKLDILAPLCPPYLFGTKRPSLEQTYYEALSQSNVDIVDVSQHPIEEIKESGIQTSAGFVEVDIVVAATGYDAVTGSLTRMNLRGTDGICLAERWKSGAKSFLGMALAHYPNFLYMYGPLAPNGFANGATSTEIQGEWIVKTLRDMRESGVRRMETTEDAQEKYTKKVDEIWNMTLFAKTKNYMQGHNIPGKPIQGLMWAAGLPAYTTAIIDCQDNGYAGFILTK